MLRRCAHIACSFILCMASLCVCNQCDIRNEGQRYVNINSTEISREVVEHLCQVDQFPLLLEYYCCYYADSEMNYDVLRIYDLESRIITDRAFRSKNTDSIKLAKIHLENQHVEELSSSAFESLSYLQEIHLSGNDLVNINDGTFNIPSLEILDLSKNKIKSFSRFSLVGIYNLKILNLSSNYLQIFDVLPSISSHHLNLDLTLNNLNYVQFENVTGIMDNINLSNNSLTAIKDCFPGFSVINFSFNKLRSITNVSCSSTPEEISYINLGSNLLFELETGVFEGMFKLKYLYLDLNELTSLPAEIFAGLTSLEFLNISHNHLKQFQDDTFDHLTSLFSLDMSCNEITELNSGAFAKMSHLRFLYLDQNNLTSLPGGIFSELKSLENLNISHNHLKHFQDGTFEHLGNLLSLDMSCNEISELKSGEFEHMSSLIYLYLNQNNLSLFPTGIFPKLNNLREFNISHNHLKEVQHGSLDHLRVLVNLDVSYNEIPTLHYGTLESLKSLLTLDLSHNKLSNIKGRLIYLKDLQDLNIEFNQLDSLDLYELFSYSTQLEKVSINGNNFLCGYLIEMLENLAERRIEVPNGHTHLEDNIHGIRCFKTHSDVRRKPPKSVLQLIDTNGSTSKSNNEFPKENGFKISKYSRNSSYSEQLCIVVVVVAAILIIMSSLILLLVFRTYVAFIRYRKNTHEKEDLIRI